MNFYGISSSSTAAEDEGRQHDEEGRMLALFWIYVRPFQRRFPAPEHCCPIRSLKQPWSQRTPSPVSAPQLETQSQIDAPIQKQQNSSDRGLEARNEQQQQELLLLFRNCQGCSSSQHRRTSYKHQKILPPLELDKETPLTAEGIRVVVEYTMRSSCTS
ncbi:hypothetical protein Emed_007589 [Eimeria media]